MSDERIFAITVIISFVLFTIIIGLHECSCTPMPQPVEMANTICMPVSSFETIKQSAFATGYQKAINEQTVYPVKLKQFTIENLQKFLKENSCDKCGDPDTGCVDRAACLLQATRDYGYDAYAVYLKSKGEFDHMIVAFPTSDNGIVFVEPLYDQFVTVKIGENYVKQLGIPGYFIPSEVIILK